MSTVYLVVEHDYEGSNVLGVFDNEALAVAYAAEYGSVSVEAWDLNPSIDDLREQRKQARERASGRAFASTPIITGEALALLENSMATLKRMR